MSSKSKKKLKSTYKSCFVPRCRNSTTRTPGKIFLCVPNDDERRQVWSMAAGYIGRLRLNSYICEDHFKLEEDLENYTQWKMMNCRKKMKVSAYPRFFACQIDPNTAESSQSSTKPAKTPRQPAILRQPTVILPVNQVWIQSDNFSASEEQPWMSYGSSSSPTSSCPENSTTIKSEFVEVKEEAVEDDYMECSSPEPTNSSNNSENSQKTPSQVKTSTHSGASFRIFPVSCGVQTEIEHVDKYIQARPSYRSVGISCCLLNLPTLTKTTRSSSRKETRASKAADENEDDSEKLKKLLSNVFESTTKLIIEDNPLLFLGVPQESMHILEDFVSATDLPLRDIYLTLKKIRHNVQNAILAYEFGVSETEVSEIFKVTAAKLAEKFHELIVWPSKKDIVSNLPVEFKLRHSDVESIIDCFEVQIEQLTYESQHVTSSECNHVKYLISITPGGLINFISIGFDNQSSDTEMIQNSGFLETVPKGSSVLADRGFKQIDNLLRREKSKLWKPPIGESNEDVIDTKPIGTLRIERVMRYLREFKMLEAYVTLDDNLLALMDDVVIIAVGVVNLQSKTTK